LTTWHYTISQITDVCTGVWLLHTMTRYLPFALSSVHWMRRRAAPYSSAARHRRNHRRRFDITHHAAAFNVSA